MELSVIEKVMRPTYYRNQLSKSLCRVGFSPQAYFAFVSNVDVRISINKG